VIESAQQEPAAYLRLANLTASISTFSIESETRLVSGGNWIREVQEVWQAGDQPGFSFAWILHLSLTQL